MGRQETAPEIYDVEHMGHVDIQAEEEILNAEIPKFILQPLVENAIIHGLEPCGRKGTVWICAMTDGENIRIEITDNGQGMSEEELEGLRKKLRYSGMPEQTTEGAHGVGMITDV